MNAEPLSHSRLGIAYCCFALLRFVVLLRVATRRRVEVVGQVVLLQQRSLFFVWGAQHARRDSLGSELSTVTHPTLGPTLGLSFMFVPLFSS